MTDLHTLARRGDVEGLLARLNEQGESVNLQNAKHETPLFVAAAHGHLEAVKTLISMGADADFVRPGGGGKRTTIPEIALVNGHPHVVYLQRFF